MLNQDPFVYSVSVYIVDSETNSSVYVETPSRLQTRFSNIETSVLDEVYN